MKEKISFWFDQKNDILDISIGKPKAAVSKEVGDDVVVRLNPKTNKVMGFTILNFTKRFKKVKTAEKIRTPIKVSMSLA